MSASIATPMAGLPNYEDYDFGPDNMPDFNVTDFPDRSEHMELDRSGGENHRHRNSESPSVQRQSSEHDHHVASSEEQKEALGNLLGALIPNQNKQSGDDSNFDVVANGMTDKQALPTNDEHAPVVSQALNDNSRLPSFDATAAADLFASEDFAQMNPSMNFTFSGNGQNTQDDGIVHTRKDSYASQGSIRRPATPQQREYEAFARLQFEDGSYYLNTYACELGRDVLAYRAALQKEREEKEAAELNRQGMSHSSSGKASHRSNHMRRPVGSQIQGSVVSEQGGFAGIDDAPMRPPPNPEKPAMSSQESESSVVKPAEYLINPGINTSTLPQFDYHKSTEMQAKWTAQEENEGVEIPDDEQPAAVTAAHLPNPNMCPLIPIHGKPKDGQTDAELHKKISRRHVKIYWNFDKDCWEMRVQGRNGAFCDDKFVRFKGIVPLSDGAVIQIAHVVLTFRLPKTAQQQQESRQTSMDIDADEALPSVESRPSESVAGDDRRESTFEQKSTPKISLKLTTQKSEPTPPNLPLGPDGQPIVKRRGPGRPPKDGIMSTRERKEREKAAKAAEERAANGGKTPPPTMRPMMRGKFVRPEPPPIEESKPEIKPEKRKYTKRKSMDENGNVLPDADGDGDEGDEASSGEPKTKKTRTQREKSESPEYPPRESLTAEQLARPPESYAVLLHKLLLELYPRALPLKDIYRELKKRYPWYVHEAQTEGWQSSVRHNLNSEYGKLFDKGDKEGKGFAWRAIPDAQIPQTEKKRTTQAPAQRPRPPAPRPQFQPLPGQSIQWQGTGAFPANGGQQNFINHGPWPQQGQASGNWQPNSTVSAQSQQVSATAPGMPQQRTNSQTPQPGLPQVRAPSQPGQPPNSNGSNTAPAPAAAAASSSSAASNMPCTLDGMLAIKRFEGEMYKQLGVDEGAPDKREFWHSIFASAKKRILHGYPASTRPEGDSKAETTIMVHMKSFVERFANPNFKGFTPRAAQPTPPEVTTIQTPQSVTPLNPMPTVSTATTSTPVVHHNQNSASLPENSAVQQENSPDSSSEVPPVSEISENDKGDPVQQPKSTDQETSTGAADAKAAMVEQEADK